MRLVLVSVCLVGALVVTGFLYQWIGARRDRHRYATTGRLICVGSGQSLYLVEKGAGELTVLFESGIAATHLNWRRIQEGVSAFARTASYDRAGLGWSSPCRTARTPGNVANELHTMIEGAGIRPPFILVGHSFGGLVMWRYALSYPEDVAGVVLVDPMRIEEWPPLDAQKQATLDRGKKLSRYAAPIARLGLARLAVTSVLCRSGWLSRRLAAAAGHGCREVLDRISSEVDKMPPEVRPAVAAHWSRPDFYVGMYSHIKAVPDTVRETLAADPIAGIPVTILTPGRSTELSTQALGRIGGNMQQVIARSSAHWIHLDQPDLVIDTIHGMVLAATSKIPAETI